MPPQGLELGCCEAKRVVYVGLGSNIGDREKNLVEAAERITALDLSIMSASSIYETEPVGGVPQPWFLNQAIGLSWREGAASEAADPRSLLRSLHLIEERMGRERTVLMGPRVIDIDLLLYRDVVIGWDGVGAADGVILPHPRLHERRFVLAPLCEIAPAAIHPALGMTIRDLLERVEDGTEVRLYRRAARSFITPMS